jgi:hypothetical protein
MKIKRDLVLFYLREKQERAGGYTGSDLVELAKLLGVTYMQVVPILGNIKQTGLKLHF